MHEYSSENGASYQVLTSYPPIWIVLTRGPEPGRSGVGVGGPGDAEGPGIGAVWFASAANRRRVGCNTEEEDSASSDADVGGGGTLAANLAYRQAK